MAKKKAEDETAVTMVTPDFLQEYMEEDTSLDQVREHRVLSRLKVLQPQASGPNLELKKKYGEGAVVMVPSRTLLVKEGEEFSFVPMFFFLEFQKWKDRRDQSDTPMIVERTFNKTSDLARRAEDKELRFEEYPGGPEDKPWEYRYVTAYQFAGVVYDEEEGNHIPTVASFAKGEAFRGKLFCDSCAARRIPLWSQVWSFTTAMRENDQGTWYGYDVMPGGNIKKEEAEAFKAEHEKLKADHKANVLRVDMSDAADEEGVEDDGDM